ncbi:MULTISPECIES: NADH-quinone oxidoreductase subunit M [unclassified Actinomyces]|uniref:NADH-quinone oxidoreductase subunit M n=1 Tax=unclassified Actinomyces TaxID=2609248 RepID=UPI000D58F6C5|nr:MULTISPECIES: NADH-quinone oxidoreductase subunit M [unclassified Actinomyces]RAX23876.1 NADH-quinone oxidoreductase subunit M [Actinomyces sp. Z3]
MNATFPVLTTMAIVPLGGALLLWLVPPLRRQGRVIGLLFALATLGVGIWTLAVFDASQAGAIQLTETHSWIPMLGVSWALGVNGLGLAMLLLTAFLVPLVLLASWGEIPADQQGLFSGLVLVLEAFVVVIFAARDVFLFYICFEAMLVPVYFLIGRFGGERRRRAALKFLLYSLAGGLIMLVGVVALYVYGPRGEGAYLVENLVGQITASTTAGRWIFASFFIAFAIKAPMVPVHTWLPDTAEQATPGTSVLLIGVLDKIGTYGMAALVLPLFPRESAWAAPVILVLAVVGIIYGGLAAVAQDNLYRLISYTSISHFGFMVLGLFVGSQIAATGAMVYMVAHGLSIAGLYLVSGFLARRTGTVAISELGGMQRVMPLIAGTFLISGLASIALPGLSGFVPEWMVLTGTFSKSVPLGVVAVLGVIIAAVYVLLPYQRVFTGAPARERVGSADLDGREKLVLVPVIAAMLAVGLAPAPLTDAFEDVAGQVAAAVEAPGETAALATVPTAPADPAVAVVIAEGNTK